MKIADEKEDPFKKDTILDEEMKKISSKKLKPNSSNLERYRGYRFFEGSKKLDKFDHFGSNIMINSDKKSVVIPLREGRNGEYVASLGDNNLHIENVNSLDLILDSKYSDSVTDSDFDIAKKYGVDIISNTLSSNVTIPKNLNEKSYEDTNLLFWRYIDQLMKTTEEYKEGLANYAGKEIHFDRYSFNSKKLEGARMNYYVDYSLGKVFDYYDMKDQVKDVYVNNSGHMYVLKDKDKVIGAFLVENKHDSPISNDIICRMDGKNLMIINNTNTAMWLKDNISFSGKNYDSFESLMKDFSSTIGYMNDEFKKIEKKKATDDERAALIAKVEKKVIPEMKKVYVPYIKVPDEMTIGDRTSGATSLLIFDEQSAKYKVENETLKKNTLPGGGELESVIIDFSTGPMAINFIKFDKIGYRIFSIGYVA